MKRYWTLIVILLVVFFAPVVLAQVSGADPETVASAALLGQQSFASLLISFFMPRIMEALKTWQRFPLMKQGAAKLNRWAAIGASVLQGSGLTYSYHQSGDGWQFVLGSHHSSFDEWMLACLVAFAANQYFYEQLPSVQAESIARAIKSAIKDSKEAS